MHKSGSEQKLAPERGAANQPKSLEHPVNDNSEDEKHLHPDEKYRRELQDKFDDWMDKAGLPE